MVVPYIRDVNPTSERLQDIVPGLRVIEAHGQHDDLEERIDSFSAGNHTVMVVVVMVMIIVTMTPTDPLHVYI